MKPEDIVAFQAALTAYSASQSVQAGGQSGATTTRAQFKDKVKAIAGLRRLIQYAVDSIWPASRKNNAGIRQAQRHAIAALIPFVDRLLTKARPARPGLFCAQREARTVAKRRTGKCEGGWRDIRQFRNQKTRQHRQSPWDRPPFRALPDRGISGSLRIPGRFFRGRRDRRRHRGWSRDSAAGAGA